MTKYPLKNSTIAILSIAILGLTSCKKNLTDETEVAAVQSLSIAEVEDDNLQIMADQAYAEGSVPDLRIAPDNSIDLLTTCAIVTRDTISSPRIITIDFGTGCTNSYGTTRKGKIFVSYTGRYRDVGTVIHITSQNYYVNDNKVDIDRTVTNQGENNNGNLVFGVQATRTVTFSDGTTCTSISSRSREWIEGITTSTFTDDVYSVTGTGTHLSRRGILYDAATVTPLIRKVACREFVSGEAKIIRHGATDRYGIINFGNGDCDETASVTLDNGRTFTISLRH